MPNISTNTLKKETVTVADFLLPLFLFLMLFPANFGGQFLDAIENMAFVLALYLLFRSRYRPSAFVLLSAAYLTLLIVVSLGMGVGDVDVHVLISTFKKVALLALIEERFRQSASRTLKLMAVALLPLVIVDVWSIVAHPEGFYFTANVHNQWTTTYTAQWFLGNKNNHVCIYLLFLLLFFLCAKKSWRIAPFFAFVLVSAVFVYCMLVTGSSTSTASVAVLLIGAAIAPLRRRPIAKAEVTLVVVSYLAISVLLVLGMTSAFGWFVEALFGKDLTFTSRASIWSQMIEMIKMQPVFGWGSISEAQFSSMMGSLAFVNGHNQLLDTVFRGGVVLLAVFIALLFKASASISEIDDRRDATVALFALMAVMLEMLMEQLMLSLPVWLILQTIFLIGSQPALRQVERRREELDEADGKTRGKRWGVE